MAVIRCDGCEPVHVNGTMVHDVDCPFDRNEMTPVCETCGDDACTCADGPHDYTTEDHAYDVPTNMTFGQAKSPSLLAHMLKGLNVA